jgi:lipopolysaccharide biosynthesis glycosyltransferase
MAAILRALTENGESFDIRWIDLDQQTGMDTSTTEYDCSQNEIVLKHITQMAPSIDPSAEQQANSVDDHSFFAPNDVVAVTGLSTSKSCAQHASSVVSFCATKQPPCMKHALDNDESPPREVPLPSSSTPHCKILWIAGFHEGPNACSGRDKYARDYSAALQSMLANAADVLQPVLVVGRYGLENENSTDLSVIGQWAQSMGAKVILWPRLSFQEHVILSSHGIGRENHQYLMGPFMRLDIPKILEQHGLLDQEGICPQHVLYTDSDVLFTSKLSHKDIMALKIDLLSKPQAIVSYGREYLMNDPLPHNTGVMMMDVPAFAKEWPSILAFTLRQPQFPLHDQELLNAYFTQSLDHENKRAMLRTFWNWKSYWRLYPHHFNEVKIVHFHGPKPDKMLEEIGNCSFMDDNSLQAVTSLYSDYEPLLLQGVCCDQGRTTHWALELFRMYVDMTAKSMEGASMKKCWT